jgi:hypothetical protein
MTNHRQPLDWPNWSSWALAGAVVTGLLTIVATLNDIW